MAHTTTNRPNSERDASAQPPCPHIASSWGRTAGKTYVPAPFGRMKGVMYVPCVWRVRLRDVLGCVASCLLGCGDDVDPCVEDDGYLGDAAVGCLGGGAPAQLWSEARRARPDGASTSGGQSLVLDESHVYFTTGDERVLSIPKGGGEARELVPISACSIRGLAVDEDWLYYTRNCADERYFLRSALERVPKEGGAPELLAQHPHQSRDVQVGGGFVFWQHVPLGMQESFVRILDLASGERPGLTDPFSPLASATGPIMPFTLRGSHVLWFDAEARALVQTPIAGGESTSTSIAAMLTGSFVEKLMSDGTCIYWHELEALDGRLAYHVGKLCGDLGVPTQAMAAPAADVMAVHEGTLYGAGDNDPSSNAYVSRVYRWAPPEFEPERLAAGLKFAQAIAVDDRNLYVLDDTFDELRLHRIGR